MSLSSLHAKNGIKQNSFLIEWNRWNSRQSHLFLSHSGKERRSCDTFVLLLVRFFMLEENCPLRAQAHCQFPMFLLHWCNFPQKSPDFLRTFKALAAVLLRGRSRPRKDQLATEGGRHRRGERGRERGEERREVERKERERRRVCTTTTVL